MSLWMTVAVTVLIIGASAFFVIIEFSLLAAKRHRLERSAASSRASRLAIRNLDELTIMLAGAQLGITVCTFALGATAKPAVHYALMPLLQDIGAPLWLADALAFAAALLAMTFLHLVVGEMAPKSWAIAHPELSARTVAVPARAFIWFFRPLLKWINRIANRLVAATGVEPVDRAADASYDPQTLHHLIRHSTETGLLEREAASQIEGIMELEHLRVDDLMAQRTKPASSIPHTSTVAQAHAQAVRSGHLRLILSGEAQDLMHVVHIRDTLRLSSETPVSEAARPALTISTGATVLEAFERMRNYGEQLIVVMDGYEPLGVITWDDVLTQLWPEIRTVLASS